MASATPRGNHTTEPLSALAMATMAPTNGNIAKSTPMIGELAEPGDPEETAVGSMGNKIDPSHQVEYLDANSSSKDHGDLEPEFEAAFASHVDDHDPGQQKQQGHINQPMSVKNEQQQQQHPHDNHHHKSHHYRRRHSRIPTGQIDPFLSGHQEQYSTHPSAQRHHTSNPQSKSRILNSSLQLQSDNRNNKRRHSSITTQNIHSENENEKHSPKRRSEKSNDPLATKSPSNTNGNFISSGKKATQRRTRSHHNQRRHEIASWFVVPRLDLSVEGGEVNPSVKTTKAEINMSIDNSDSKNHDGGKKRMVEKAILEGEMESTEKEAKRSEISTPADEENARHFDLNTRTVDNVSKIRNQNPTNAEENQESKGAQTSTPHTKPKKTETQPPFEEMESITVAKPTKTLHRQEKNDHSTYHHHDRNSDSQEKVATGETFANLNSLSEGENWVVCSFYDNWGSAYDISDKRSGVKENSFIVNDGKSASASANAIDRATTPIATVESSTSQRLSFRQQPLHLSIVKSHRNLYVEGGRIKGRTLPPPTTRIGCAPTGVAPKVSDHFLMKDDSNVEGVGSIERDDIKMRPLEKGEKTDAEGVQFVSEREVNEINGESTAKKQEMFGSGVAVLCIDVDYDGNFVAVKDIRVGLTPAMQQQQHQQHQHMQTQQLQNQGLEILPLSASGRISENHNESHNSKREFLEMQLAEELEIFLVRRKPVHKQKLQYQPPTEAKPNDLGVDATTDNLEVMELETSKHYSEDDLLASGSDSNEDSLHNNGYDTDDEKEGDDDMEDLNERSAEVRFCEDVTPLLERSKGGTFNMAEGGQKGRSHCRKPLVHFRPPPPREKDVDHEGHLLYYGPEPLPRRQLRVLREGDRILMRYWPLSCSDQCGWKESLHGYPCVAKFEYIYGRHHHKNPLQRKPKDSITQAVGISISPQAPSQVAAVIGDSNPAVLANAPLLLSVKSDVKSEEKKQFTLNSTSAAEAPTDGNFSVNAKKGAHANKTKKVVDRHRQHHHHHHQNCHDGEDLLHGKGDAVAEVDAVGRKTVVKDWAGKDWSAVESEIDGAEGFGGDGEKGGTPMNIGQNDVDDDDDGMEEYSYLTGEVVIKDQDYISAITGDDATMPSAMVLEYGDEGEYEQVPYDGEDAATASAVVLGAATSPSKSAVVAGRTLRGIRDGEKKDDERHDDFFRTGSCTPKRTTSKAHISEGHISRSSGRKSFYRSEKLVAEAVVRAPEGNELEPLFTPASKEHDSDETGIRSEDELLSQPADNESSQKLGGAETASRGRISGNGISETDVRVSAGKKNDSSNDVDENISLTQPFPIPDNIKLSHGGNDPDDDTTDVSLTQPVPKCVSTNAEVKLSQHSLSTDGEEKDNEFAEPPNLVATPDKSEHPDGDNGCPDNNGYDETTQDFMIPEISNMHSKDDEEFQVDTQFELPTAFTEAVDSPQHDKKIAHTENTAERNHDDDEPDEHGKAGIVRDEKPSAELKAEPAIDTKTGIIHGLKSDDAKGVKTRPAPKTKSFTKVAKLYPSDSHEESQNEMRSRRFSGRRAAPDEAYNDSALQTQRVQNSAVHRVWSGAIMTGPVGGASPDIGRGVGLSSPSAPNPDMRRTEKDLLTSIALLSNDPNPNPLPDAAASSEETTVCQMDDTDLAKEQGSTTNGPKDIMVAFDAVERKTARVEHNDTRVGRDECFRDPDIPTEVSFVDKGRGRYGRHSNESSSTQHHRSTRRQREVLFSELRPDTENEKIRVIFTGITPTSRHKRLIDSIGAELVESVEEAASATHVIVSDGKSKLRRTPKLMICISKVSKILSIDWLVRSAMEQKILDTDDFLLLEDKEAEKTYNFSMKQTLENGITARRERGGVLGGWSVYICANVAGNRAPSTRELTLIIHAAGGKSMNSLSEANFTDPSKLIILTSDPSTNAQLKEDGVETVERLGAKVATTTWLFHTIITQKISHDYDGSAGPPRRGKTDSFIPQSGKPRAKRKLSERNVSPNHDKRRRSTRKQG